MACNAKSRICFLFKKLYNEFILKDQATQRVLIGVIIKKGAQLRSWHAVNAVVQTVGVNVCSGSCLARNTVCRVCAVIMDFGVVRCVDQSEL